MNETEQSGTRRSLISVRISRKRCRSSDSSGDFWLLSLASQNLAKSFISVDSRVTLSLLSVKDTVYGSASIAGIGIFIASCHTGVSRKEDS